MPAGVRMLVRQGRGPFTTVVYPHADEQAALSDISQTALVFPERFGAFLGCPGLFLGSPTRLAIQVGSEGLQRRHWNTPRSGLVRVACQGRYPVTVLPDLW